MVKKWAICVEFYFQIYWKKKDYYQSYYLNILILNHELYQDLLNSNLTVEFRNYIYSLLDIKDNKQIPVLKTPTELLDEAGYILYECKCEEDIQSFRKYYKKEEELCTFKERRLAKCYVFLLLKKMYLI